MFMQIIYKYSVLTSQRTQCFSIIKINQLMLYSEIIGICENYLKHVVSWIRTGGGLL
jgi:hypothetical protein